MGEWRKYKISEIALPDGVAGGPFGSELVRSDYIPSGVPVIRGTNLGSSDQRFDANDFVFVSDSKADALSRNLAIPGDIIVTQRGTLGQVGIVPQIGFDRFVISQSQMRLRCDPRQADPLFVYYSLLHPEIIRHIKSNAVAAGVPHINLGFFRAMQLPLPSLPVQRAIAHILGTLDDKIELNRRMNETLEAMARALFKSWFVDFDPVRAKAEGRQPRGIPSETASLFPRILIETDAGLIPEGWHWTTVGSLTKQHGGEVRTGPFGTVLQASEYCSPDVDGVPVIAVRDIGAGHLKLDNKTPRVTQVVAERLSTFKVKSGDILFGRKGAIERFAVIGPHQEGWLMGSDCIRLRLTEDYSEYLRFHFLQKQHRDWMAQNATGTTMPSLNQSIIERIPVLHPSDSLVSAFTHMVRPLDEKIRSNHEETESLAKIRDALLPRLLSGTLPVAET